MKNHKKLNREARLSKKLVAEGGAFLTERPGALRQNRSSRCIIHARMGAMCAALGEPGVSRYFASADAFGMLSMPLKITQGSGVQGALPSSCIFFCI